MGHAHDPLSLPARRVARAEAAEFDAETASFTDSGSRRFSIPSAAGGLEIRGSWEIRQPMAPGLRVARIEAALKDRLSAIAARLGGVIVSEERPGASHGATQEALAGVAVRDAVAAMTAAGAPARGREVLIMDRVAGLSAADRRLAWHEVVVAICAWRPGIAGVGRLVAPGHDEVVRIARRADVARRVAAEFLERSRRAEAEAFSVPGGRRLVILDSAALEQGRVASRATANPEPVPGRLLAAFWEGARNLSGEDRTAFAVDMARSRACAADACFAVPEAEAEIARSLILRAEALDAACGDAEIGVLLARLNHAGWFSRILDVAATAPVDAGRGRAAGFGSDFRTCLVDMADAAA